MKRRLILAVSFSLLISCSTSRNVKRDKTQIETDSLAVGLKKTDSTNIKTIDLNYVFNANEMTFKPVDNTKPMAIGGNKYENVEISKIETKVLDKTKIKDFTALKKSYSTEVSINKNIELNKKEADAKSEGFIMKYIAIGTALIFVIYFIIWLYNKKNPSN